MHENCPIRLISPSLLEIAGTAYRCTIGRHGVAAAGDKREGDLKTPSGLFAMRGCYYRPDRMAPPATHLPLMALTPEDGWCDDPAHPLYNQPVKLPFMARHEKLWRDDHVYDLIIPLGYNDGGDGPIIPGHGSAIFLHLMRPDGVGTEGCIAVEQEVLLRALPQFTTQTKLWVAP